MRYLYPPRLTDQAIEYAPIQGAAPPPAHVGYRVDPLNPWRQTSEWRPCSARQVGMRPRKCGRALLTMICNSDGCPLQGRIIRPDDCAVRSAGRKNQVWCWDFAFDRTSRGTTLKWLSIVDEYTRECLALKVDRGITSEDVIDTLAELLSMRGVPECIRSDNGPEFISTAIQEWLQRLRINAWYIAPGSPWENGYAESFHSKLRDEFLSQEEFESLRAARTRTQAWRDDYNHDRQHSGIT